MPGSDLRLLALDGGGVRGLSSLMILEQLMEAVNPDNPPLPCEYFDMIGGTSTGGLIAIMLGRLKMSVEECIKAYVQLSERVFQKSRHRVKINGKLQGRFDAEELVRAIKEVVKQKNQPEDALLKDESNARCKVFVCATSKETCGTVCLTSYRTSRGNSDLLNSVTIWEACRATSAATTFFDPIGVGRFGEEFVDGATGANNPVREVWGQAQLVWGPEPLEGKVKCLVSIGTGVPSLKPFKDDALNIGSTLAAIATETEKTAEQFQSEHGLLDSTGRYYRFNVQRGLEDIGLEEAKKVREMAAATRQYILSYEVHKRMQACAGSISGRNYFGEYCTLFSLEGVPQTHHFVERPTEMAQLERVLLPQLKQKQRQKIYVLHGLGGMGKTQLAVEFARRHHEKFSSVFWLDGQREDILKRSIARCAARIPEGQINETSRTYAADGNVSIDTVVKDVLAWLALSDNTAWLLIFDNVDREYTSQGGDPEAYDIRRFLSGADHGSVLVTTRLARLEQLGESQQLGRVSAEQGQAILESWYKENHSTAESERLLAKLGGLPLAIAQAGAYLQETGVGLVKYLEFYERQWDELMKPDNSTDAPLLDYPDRSVWTTWTISYQAILKKQPNAAHLLLLWSFLDNKDLWYGLFAAASANSPKAGWVLSAWIGDIASSEVKFSKAMQMLRNYSLAEKVAETSSYTTHPVVHQWAHHSQGRSSSTELSRLATIAVGFAVPSGSDRNSIMLQQRLLPHAQVCSRRIIENEADWWLGVGNGCRQCDGKCTEREMLLHATHFLALLYDYQGRLCESEQMFKRALRGFERNFGPDNEITLYIMVHLGDLYESQSRLEEAEQIYEQALPWFEVTMPNTVQILQLFDKLGTLYRRQGRLDEAEQMHERALRGVERKLGPNDETTLRIANNTGLLYKRQNRLDSAKRMFERALREAEKQFGPNHPLTLQTVSYLGDVYYKQGKSDGAEQMYERALRGYEEVFGSDGVQQYLPALDTIQHLGHLYLCQKNLTKGYEMYERALSGLNDVLGPSHERCKELAAKVKHLVDDHLSDAGRDEEVVLNQGSMADHLSHASKEREDPSNEESAALVARSNELSVGKKQVEQQRVVGHSPHAGMEREALLNRRNTESAADELSIIRKEEEEVSRLPTRVGEPAVQQGKRKKKLRVSIRRFFKKVF